jgi:Fe-S-cluster-containing dehydrogenase component
MEESRRRFFRIAAASLLALGAKPLKTLGGYGGGSFSRLGTEAPRRRWAMAVDLTKCREGCRDCIEACHQVHNVPDFGNPKDEIKWIWQEPFRNVFPAHEHPWMAREYRRLPVVVLCNHCDQPPCVRVCPTQATFRREEDGIVMMDYHRCIGCRFCVAGCPYGARSMNFRDPRPFIRQIDPRFPTRTKGVVEKCNFCEERLAQGRLPACVEACKERALIFGNLEDPASEIRQVLQNRFSLRRKPELGTQPQIYYLV